MLESYLKDVKNRTIVLDTSFIMQSYPSSIAKRELGMDVYPGFNISFGDTYVEKGENFLHNVLDLLEASNGAIITREIGSEIRSFIRPLKKFSKRIRSQVERSRIKRPYNLDILGKIDKASLTYSMLINWFTTKDYFDVQRYRDLNDLVQENNSKDRLSDPDKHLIVYSLGLALEGIPVTLLTRDNEMRFVSKRCSNEIFYHNKLGLDHRTKLDFDFKCPRLYIDKQWFQSSA